MRITALSGEDRLHLGRIGSSLLVHPQGRDDFLRGRLKPALGQEPASRFASSGMDKAQGLDLQSGFLQRPVEIASPLDRVDETGAAVLLQNASGGPHYIKNVAFYLMLGDGFFLGSAEVPSPALDVRGVRENQVELLARPKGPEVLLQDEDFLLEAIEGDIAAGQVGQAGLDLQADDPPERLAAEKERDDAVAGAQLEQPVPRPGADEISQERGVDRKPVSLLLLEEEDAAGVERVEGFSLAGRGLTPLHLRSARQTPPPAPARFPRIRPGPEMIPLFPPTDTPPR